MLSPPTGSSLSSPTASPQQPAAHAPRPDGSSGSFRDRLGAARREGSGQSSPGASRHRGEERHKTTEGHDRGAAASKSRGSPGRDRSSDGDKAPAAVDPLLLRPDGTLVVAPAMPLLSSLVTAAGSRPRAASSEPAGAGSTASSAASEPALDARAVALSRVRVGGAPGAAQLHATLAEGRHAGVELRAVEHNGRVAIELVAPGAAEARALRAEMAEVREMLAARGLDGAVSVDVRTDLDDRDRERRREAPVVIEGDEGAAVQRRDGAGRVDLEGAVTALGDGAQGDVEIVL